MLCLHIFCKQLDLLSSKLEICFLTLQNKYQKFIGSAYYYIFRNIINSYYVSILYLVTYLVHKNIFLIISQSSKYFGDEILKFGYTNTNTLILKVLIRYLGIIVPTLCFSNPFF